MMLMPTLSVDTQNTAYIERKSVASRHNAVECAMNALNAHLQLLATALICSVAVCAMRDAYLHQEVRTKLHLSFAERTRVLLT